MWKVIVHQLQSHVSSNYGVCDQTIEDRNQAGDQVSTSTYNSFTESLR